MANDGDGVRFPRLGDIERSLNGVSEKAWILMLQHDPSCWRRTILPKSNAKLTLCGHTHAMQFALLIRSFHPICLSNLTVSRSLATFVAASAFI